MFLDGGGNVCETQKKLIHVVQILLSYRNVFEQAQLVLHSVKKMKVLHLELSLTVPSFSLLITLWSLEQCLVTCLSTGRTVVLFGPEEQIRVSKAAGDV